jgi:hypothetical protein
MTAKGTLPKAYLRLDPNIDQVHPEHLEAFIRLLCVAARQQRRGRFADRVTLDALFGRRTVDRFVSRRDLVPEGDCWYVDGWDEWQEGDWTVSERKARIRARQERTPSVPAPYQERASTVPPRLIGSRQWAVGSKAAGDIGHTTPLGVTEGARPERPVGPR